MLLQFVKNLADENSNLIQSAVNSLFDELQELQRRALTLSKARVDSKIKELNSKAGRLSFELQELQRRALTYKGAAKGRVTSTQKKIKYQLEILSAQAEELERRALKATETPRQKEIKETLNFLTDKDKIKRDLFIIQYAQDFKTARTIYTSTFDYILNAYFDFLAEADSLALGNGADFVDNIKGIFADCKKIGTYTALSFAPQRIANKLKDYEVETLSAPAYSFADCEDITQAAEGAKIYGTIPPVYWFLFKKEQQPETETANYLSAAFAAHTEIRDTLSDSVDMYLQGLQYEIKAEFLITGFSKGSGTIAKYFPSVEKFSDYVDPTLYDSLSPKRGTSSDYNDFTVSAVVNYKYFKKGVKKFYCIYYISFS